MSYINSKGYGSLGARTKQTSRRTMGAIPGLVEDNPLDVLRQTANQPGASTTRTSPSSNAAGLAALRAAANRPGADSGILGRQIGEGAGGMSIAAKLFIGAAVLGGAAFLLARKK